jgi:hypothetical protein
MKAYEVVGWTMNGAAYCAQCVPTEPKQGADDDAPHPVFASDASDFTCDCCFDYLIEQDDEIPCTREALIQGVPCNCGAPDCCDEEE